MGDDEPGRMSGHGTNEYLLIDTTVYRPSQSSWHDTPPYPSARACMVRSEKESREGAKSACNFSTRGRDDRQARLTRSNSDLKQLGCYDEVQVLQALYYGYGSLLRTFLESDVIVRTTVLVPGTRAIPYVNRSSVGILCWVSHHILTTLRSSDFEVSTVLILTLQQHVLSHKTAKTLLNHQPALSIIRNRPNEIPREVAELIKAYTDSDSDSSSRFRFVRRLPCTGMI